uniref:Uncharacterized protein n=1 Tax=Rhizophora mucronata TaxID=61149 RepID=A0A2P2J0L6_RHIMU
MHPTIQEASKRTLVGEKQDTSHRHRQRQIRKADRQHTRERKRQK